MSTQRNQRPGNQRRAPSVLTHSPQGSTSHTNCDHDKILCIDSRRRDDYRYRRYICTFCKARFTTIEIEIGEERAKGERLEQHRALLASLLTDAQCRSLIEQMQAGHSRLNLPGRNPYTAERNKFVLFQTHRRRTP